jgi:UrcA family protein
MKTFVLVLALSAATPVLANQTAVTDAYALPSVNVKYGDLDLSSHVGLSTLYLRLRRGAHEVCEGILFSATFNRQQYEECRSSAIVRAVADLNRPAFTSFVSEQFTPARGTLKRIATAQSTQCAAEACR